MPANYLRAYRVVEEEEEGGPMVFVASTEGVKRDGQNLKANDWNLTNYRKNPVFLWVHDYWGRTLPIGRTDASIGSDNKLRASVVFDEEDDFAMKVKGKYERGFLNAVSVGWDGRGDENELLDISAVPVPGDPDALIERQVVGLRAAFPNIGKDFIERFMKAYLEEIGEVGGEPLSEPSLTDFEPRYFRRKSDLPLHSDKEREWDGSAAGQRMLDAATDEDGNIDVSRASEGFTYFVGDRSEPKRGDFKSPFADIVDGRKVVVFRGVVAAIGRNGQVKDISDEERSGGESFLNGQRDRFPKSEETERGQPVSEALLAELEDFRAGAVLSKRNKDDLEQAVLLIQAVIERAIAREGEEEGEPGEGGGERTESPESGEPETDELDQLLLEQVAQEFTRRSLS